MRFEITHEFDAPLDAVELAVLSPDLGRLLARSLSPTIESVETIEHVLEGGELRRVLRFCASGRLPLLGGWPLAREAMAIEQLSTYRLADHASRWSVSPPRLEWRRYVRSEGTYRLEARPNGRTRRTVSGELVVRPAMLGKLLERRVVAEVRKTFEAEAEALREMATS